jgi:hypothetical protein
MQSMRSLPPRIAAALTTLAAVFAITTTAA